MDECENYSAIGLMKIQSGIGNLQPASSLSKNVQKKMILQRTGVKSKRANEAFSPGVDRSVVIVMFVDMLGLDVDLSDGAKMGRRMKQTRQPAQRRSGEETGTGTRRGQVEKKVVIVLFVQPW